MFVLFGILAEVQWTELRHLDEIAPTDGYLLSSHTAALRIPTPVITNLGSPLAVEIATVLATAWLLPVRHCGAGTWPTKGVLTGALQSPSTTLFVVDGARAPR
jgi:hypothetical protein